LLVPFVPSSSSLWHGFGIGVGAREDKGPMTESEVQAKLAELDRLLNDPEVRLDPHRIWTLLAELSAQALGAPSALPVAR
jgi:hypothetical protein